MSKETELKIITPQQLDRGFRMSGFKRSLWERCPLHVNDLKDQEGQESDIFCQVAIPAPNSFVTLRAIPCNPLAFGEIGTGKTLSRAKKVYPLVLLFQSQYQDIFRFVLIIDSSLKKADPHDYPTSRRIKSTGRKSGAAGRSNKGGRGFSNYVDGVRVVMKKYSLKRPYSRNRGKPGGR